MKILTKISFIILIAILFISLTGCDIKKPICQKQALEKERFEKVYYNDGCTIITDKKTGKEYLFVKSGYGGGLTELK